MPDLNFQIAGVKAVPYSVSPLLGFDLEIGNSGGEPVDTVALRCQVQIECHRRRYSAGDQGRLSDLFGEPQRWGQTLRSLLWTQVSVHVPGFTATTHTELAVPCTFDFNVAAVKYFSGLEDGEIPLCFQFSGTVFYRAGGQMLQAAPISWDKEAKFRLPLQVWKDMMELYYPGVAWLCLNRDVFERLRQYKTSAGISSWEETLERLLAQRAEREKAWV